MLYFNIFVRKLINYFLGVVTMNRFSVIFLFLFAFCEFSTICPHRVVEIVSIYCKKEVINGKVFIYRDDMVNSEKKEIWSIDGQLVKKDEYEEAILDAEREVRRQERQQEEEQRKKAQLFKGEMTLVLQKKILRLTVDKIDELLKKFDTHNLKDFLAYKKQTISKELFDDLKGELLPEAKRLVYKKDEEYSWDDMNLMLAKVENLDEKLDLFYQDTVRNAIQQCDDTRVLKDLLELVS